MKKYNYKKLKKEFDNKYKEEFDKIGIFWAFGNYQFEENKTHKDAPDSQYRSIGYGGYIHESNLPKYRNFYNDFLPKLKREFSKKINIDDLIDEELINHECWYTGDYMEIVPIIQDFFTKLSTTEIIEKIKNVYNSHPERFEW